MDFRLYCILFSCSVFAITSLVYGLKFLKKRNPLVGLEWLALGISGVNVIVFLLTGSKVSGEVMHFLDGFSRGFGLPIVAVIGLMEVTGMRRLSIAQDIMLIVAAIVGAVILVFADFLNGVRPYFYVVMWTWLSAYLVYFIVKLLEIEETFHALSMLVALLSSLAIACIYDFYKIPGDESNAILNFPFLALLTWAYFVVSIYYAYCALERGTLKHGSFVRA
ncbi:hypothetical protein AWV79_20420 [Cupriavidus sp. UYMMa02A]|nr:hypothetical protein AWV79_20420 [Cupriavidus sp. UYMMa02A]